MRIIAGEFRGRPIKSIPTNDTRPTLDQVKEGMFNALGQFFEGGIVLDLYAGSGNLGLEALSRGCDRGYFFDQNIKAVRVINENIDSLKVSDRAKVTKLDAFKALDMLKAERLRFDLIFLDPPYHKERINELLKLIIDGNLLEEDGSIICETLKESELLENYQSLVKYREYLYGMTKVTIYHKEGVTHE